MSRRHTFEPVKKFFEDAGCELLESEYKDNKTKMRYRCSCGNESSIIYNSFQNGHRCRQCSYEKSADGQKLGIDYVRKQFMKLINALDNLRPLSASKNRSKNTKYNQAAFLHYLKMKGISVTPIPTK